LRARGFGFCQGRLNIVFDRIFKTAPDIDQRIALNRQIEIEAECLPFPLTAIGNADKNGLVGLHIPLVHVHCDHQTSKEAATDLWIQNPALTESVCDSRVNG
jgi:hypothetical protein